MTRNISAVIFDRDNTLTRFDSDAIAAAVQYRLSNTIARALELAGSTYYSDFVALPDAIDCLQSLQA